jgi:hypothetical protein
MEPRPGGTAAILAEQSQLDSRPKSSRSFWQNKANFVIASVVRGAIVILRCERSEPRRTTIAHLTMTAKQSPHHDMRLLRRPEPALGPRAARTRVAASQ